MSLGIQVRSIRTKLLLLVTAVAFIVGAVSGLDASVSSGRLLREQMVLRGDYIASNLAYNSKYGVLTEDKPLLTQLLDGAMAASGAENSDVIGGIIRDAKGAILAQKGEAIRDLPATPAAALEDRDAYTASGEAVILFRAPVTTASAGGADLSAEFGLAPAGGATAKASAEEQKGGVEVAISKRMMADRQRAALMRTVGVASVLFVLGTVVGFYLTGRWLRPIQTVAEVASIVAKGDLTESLVVQSNDEVGMLAGSFNEMTANLRRIVDRIQETSVQVASSAGEISANAKLITQGAQSQAQAAEETSTSMEQMAASIQTVAGNAHSLASYVEETSSSITEMGASIEQVARSSGTLATTVAEASATIEEMAVSIDQTAKNLESLSDTVGNTSVTIEEMTSSIEAVARNAEVLSVASSRASQTVSEMAGAVNQVAKIAEEADRISQKASDDARSGDASVSTTIQGMKTISETMENTARVITSLGKRSQEIGKILEVIEEIADQTNLLALNAAIEAARAGDVGRGFAVVAEEVRRLAERSVDSIREIGKVIEAVQRDTAHAVDLTKAVLDEIGSSVNRTTGLVADVHTSTEEQSRGAAQIVATTGNMQAITQQLAHAAREQSNGLRSIMDAVDNMTRMTQLVATATKEQKRGGDMVVKATEEITAVARQNLATSGQLSGTTASLVKEAETLQLVTSRFAA